MPCNYYGPGEYEATLSQENLRLEAALCAFITAAEKLGMYWETRDVVDWAEAGVSNEWFDAWWIEHKRKDAERRQREADALKRRNMASQVIDKLTPEEREALGIRS